MNSSKEHLMCLKELETHLRFNSESTPFQLYDPQKTLHLSIIFFRS